MLKLMKLEIKKNKMSTYLKASFGIFVFCLFMCFLTGFIPIIELREKGVIPPDIEIFTTWNGYISLITTLMMSSFAILGAVMQSKFTLEEYIGKKSILLFSYPVKRRKVLLAKCLLVFAFTLVSCFITTFISVVLFALVSRIFNIMAEVFNLTAFAFLIKSALINSFLSASITLFALRIGFWKKSLISVIVTAVILITPFGNLSVLFPDLSGVILFFSMILYMIVGLFFFIELFAKVDKMEVI